MDPNSLAFSSVACSDGGGIFHSETTAEMDQIEDGLLYKDRKHLVIANEVSSVTVLQKRRVMSNATAFVPFAFIDVPRCPFCRRSTVFFFNHN